MNGSRALAALAALALISPPATAAADCAAPAALTEIASPLEHSAQRLMTGGTLRIVAVGSSSTSGIGASGPAETYPSRLAVALKRRLPDHVIRVFNRGKGGQDVGMELTRLDRDVIAAHPDLVIWQVGTNAILRRENLVADGVLLQRGIALLKAGGADVALMDLQYAPRVLERRHYPVMERLLAETAKQERVGLIQRFAIMRYWHDRGEFGAPLIGRDGLHMTDASYDCLARDVAGALTANWAAYGRLQRRAPAIAGLSPQVRAVAGVRSH